MTDTPSEFLIAAEVARWLRLKRSTVYRWAATGKIPSLKLNGTIRFIRSDVECWINDRYSIVVDSPPAMIRPIVPPNPAAVSRQTIQRAGTRAIRQITGRQSSQQNSISGHLLAPSNVGARKDTL